MPVASSDADSSNTVATVLVYLPRNPLSGPLLPEQKGPQSHQRRSKDGVRREHHLGDAQGLELHSGYLLGSHDKAKSMSPPAAGTDDVRWDYRTTPSTVADNFVTGRISAHASVPQQQIK